MSSSRANSSSSSSPAGQIAKGERRERAAATDSAVARRASLAAPRTARSVGGSALDHMRSLKKDLSLVAASTLPAPYSEVFVLTHSQASRSPFRPKVARHHISTFCLRRASALLRLLPPVAQRSCAPASVAQRSCAQRSCASAPLLLLEGISRRLRAFFDIRNAGIAVKSNARSRGCRELGESYSGGARRACEAISIAVSL